MLLFAGFIALHPLNPLVSYTPTPSHLGAQLTERRKGNDAYRNGDYAKALHHYERAAAVVELVQVCWGACAA